MLRSHPAHAHARSFTSAQSRTPSDRVGERNTHLGEPESTHTLTPGTLPLCLSPCLFDLHTDTHAYPPTRSRYAHPSLHHLSAISLISVGTSSCMTDNPTSVKPFYWFTLIPTNHRLVFFRSFFSPLSEKNNANQV